MESSKVEQSEYIQTPSSEAITALEGSKGSQPLLPPAETNQAQQIADQVANFFKQFPEYLNTFFNEYRKPIINIGLIIAAIVSLRLLFAVMDAINDIPLLYSFFELVGIGYAAWFVFRYLLKTSTRQELAEKISSIQRDFFGNNS